MYTSKIMDASIVTVTYLFELYFGCFTPKVKMKYLSKDICEIIGIE